MVKEIELMLMIVNKSHPHELFHLILEIRHHILNLGLDFPQSVIEPRKARGPLSICYLLFTPKGELYLRASHVTYPTQS